MITDQIVVPVNHNHYNSRENKINAFLFHCLMLQIRPFWKIPSLVGQVVVAMIIVINSVTGGLS